MNSACRQKPATRRVKKSAMKKVTWVCASPAEYRQLYERHRSNIIAANGRLALEIEAASIGRPLHPDADEVGIYVWCDLTGCGRLPDNNAKGLETAVALGDISAKVYSYSKPVNLPVGVEWCDAEDVLPSAERAFLTGKGVSPAVLADLARLRAMKKE